MKTNRKNTITKLIATVLCLSMLTACGNVTGTFAERKDNSKDIAAMLTLLPQTGTLQTVAKATEEPVAEPEETAEPKKVMTETSQEIADVAQEIAEVIPEETPEPVATPEPVVEATPEPVTALEPEIIAEMTITEPIVIAQADTGDIVPAKQRPDYYPAVCYSYDEVISVLENAYHNIKDMDWRHGYDVQPDGTYVYSYYTGPDTNGYDEMLANTTPGTTIKDKVAELKAMYPDGSSWSNNTYYDNPGSKLDAYISNNNACAGFVKMFSDYLYGHNAPVYSRLVDLANPNEGLFIGDIIIFDNHAVVFTGGEIQLDSTRPGYISPAMVQGNVVFGDADMQTGGIVRWSDAGEFVLINPDGTYTVWVLSRCQ